MPAIGELVKVYLPGESPWAECTAIHSDGTWEGRIDNKLFHEYSEHEQARFLKREFGTFKPLPAHHNYCRNDVVRFRRQVTSDYEIWVPVK